MRDVRKNTTRHLKFDLSIISPAVQEKIYDDLLQGLAANCGEALKTLSEFILTPLFLLRLTNASARQRFEVAMRKLEARYKEIPPSQRIQPPPEIAELILEEVVKIDDQELSAMFIELLAKASTDSAEHKVHRAFVTSLREMVPDEARIVQHLSDNRFVPFIRFMGSRYLPFSDRLTALDQKLELAIATSLPLYLENLVRLGVLECVDDLIYAHSEGMYSELIARYSHDGYAFCYKFDIEAPFKVVENEVHWKRGFYRYTMYGKHFRAACCISSDLKHPKE